MKIEELNGKKELCVGIPPDESKQKFLSSISKCGLELAVLQFPGERFFWILYGINGSDRISSFKSTIQSMLKMYRV